MSAGFGWSRCLRFAILTSHSSKSILPYAADGRPGWRQPFPVVLIDFSSNIGAGARDESTLAASVATSGAMRVLVDGIPEEIPSGLWCYRIDRSRSLLGRARERRRPGRQLAGVQVRLWPVDDGNLILAAAPQPGGQRTGSPRRSFGSHNRGKALAWSDGRRRDLLRQDRRSASIGGRPAATDPGKRAGN